MTHVVSLARPLPLPEVKVECGMFKRVQANIKSHLNASTVSNPA